MDIYGKIKCLILLTISSILVELHKGHVPQNLIITIVLLPVIVVIIAIVLVITYIRKGLKCNKGLMQDNIQQVRTEEDTRRSLVIDIEASTPSHSESIELPEQDFGDEMHIEEEITSCTPIADLRNVILKIKENEESSLRRSYSSLPSGEQRPCNTGKSKGNLFKNRYKTILPYDHSRVVLREKYDTSDYINANYIKDVQGTDAYIATQGPKLNTSNSFWAMICQENVSQIVTLTKLEEGGKIKCIQYWPNFMKERSFGSYVIKNVDEKQYAVYNIRRLIVSNKKNQSSHIVTQYHYNSWLDHGIPDPLCLVVFHSHVLRTRADNDTSQCVVHCSAGVGRTGTYIALDALYKEGKRTGKINVAEYVRVMRSCRMNMVQTYKQYELIFLALHEGFKASVEIQSLTDFMVNTKSLAEDFTDVQRTIQREFEKLLPIRPEYTIDDYREAKQQALKMTTVLPLDKFLLCLTSPVNNRGGFINAINVPSFCQNNAFIVTQYPTPEDAVDFLRLLIDHESNTVICMDLLSDIESSPTWLAGLASVKAVPPFTVQHVGEIDTNVRVTNLRILGREDLSHPVLIVEPRGIIKPGGSQQDTSSLLSLVSYALSISTEGPITIVSMDGASLCGVFCAVFNSVQQINMDNNVDVFTTVRQLQTRRPEFCFNLDEYWLVYRALRDYIGTTTENMYCNV